MPDRTGTAPPARAETGRTRIRGRRAHRDSGELEQLVLSILRKDSTPLGAYRIARYSKERGTILAPNQVYRILVRLEAQGKVRRVELLNAYMEATSDHAMLMICRNCKRVTTLHLAIAHDVQRICRARDFQPHVVIAEIPGCCPGCSARVA